MASSVQQQQIDEHSAGQRLDNFLVKMLKGVPKSHIYRIVRKGEVRVNKGRIKVDYRLQVGDVVRIPPIREAERPTTLPPQQQLLEQLRQSILFEDSRYLILNKPAGIAVHGGSGVSYGVIEGLRALRPEAPYLELGHRLDRDTSGVLLLAKKRSALRSFQRLLQEGKVEKHYFALVEGQWLLPLKGKRIETALVKNQLSSGERIVRVDEEEGKQSISHFYTDRLLTGATLMRVEIETGRTHQIRVQCQESGHPVAGDEKYGSSDFNRQLAEQGLKRLFLHAASLRFTLEAEQTYHFEAPLAEELQQWLAQSESRERGVKRAL